MSTPGRRAATRPPAAVLLLGLALASPAPAQMLTTATEQAAVHCQRPQERRLECDLRVVGEAGPASVAAHIGKLALPLAMGPAFADTGAGLAVLLLVDTSDPARAPVIARIREQIARLVEAAEPGLALGLARFDSDIEMLAPIGAPDAAILEAAASLRAVGQTTELYRAVRQAARVLGREQAGRRFLYLFSDGLAEDFAYTHGDAVTASREAGVSIVALGYPRSVALSVALQSLRKLAEDTGGRYLAADNEARLPAAFLEAPFAGLREGQLFSLELTPATEAGLGGRQAIALAINAGARDIRLDLPVRLPPVPLPKPPPPTEREAAPAPATAARESAPPPARPPRPEPVRDSPLAPWIWFGTPAAMLLAVLVALVVYGRIWRQRAGAAAAPAGAGTEYAYLLRRDDEAQRHVISTSPFRIGRGKNNELIIDDNSVSRQHAEIHRRHDGSFTVMDLDSLNGVFVNDKKVKSADLNEGDELDVGDVPLRFTLYDEDQAAQEPTVMVGTRAPE